LLALLSCAQVLAWLMLKLGWAAELLCSFVELPQLFVDVVVLLLRQSLVLLPSGRCCSVDVLLLDLLLSCQQISVDCAD